MDSGDSKQNRSLFGFVQEKAGVVYRSLGFGDQGEEASVKSSEESVGPVGMESGGEQVNSSKADANLTMDAAGRSLLTAECEASDEMFHMNQNLKQFKMEMAVKESQISKLLQEKKETADALHEKDTFNLALQSQLASLHGNYSQSEALNARLQEQMKVLYETSKIDEKKIKELEQHVEMQSKRIAEIRRKEPKQMDRDSVELEVEFARSNDIRRIQELEDDLAKVREDFESARSNLEKEQAERKLLISKFSSDGQGHLVTDECANQLCIEKQLELNRLLTEEESWNIKLSSLQRVADYFKAAHGEMTKERDEALNECAIAKAEAEIFKNDFEEERKDRERAQGALVTYTNKKSYTKIFEGQIAELNQEIAKQKGMVNTHKIQIAQMTAEMKSKSQTSKEVIRAMKEKVEELSRDIDYYRKKASKIPQLDSELQKCKKVLKDVTSKLNQKVMELSQLKKEAIKLKEQVSHANNTQVTFSNALDRTKEKLANVKLEYQELKKAYRKLEDQVKKKERTKKISKHASSASVEEPDESSFEHLYDMELQRNLELTGEIDYLKNRIEDLSMEIQEHKKLMHEITKYRVEVDQEPPTGVDTPSSGQSHQMETRSNRLAARNTTQLDHNYQQLPGGGDQDTSSDICSMPGLDKPPIPPRGTNRSAYTDIVSDRDHKRKVEGVHEALHDKRPSTQSENTEQGIMEVSAINKDGTIPTGDNGLPLRATMPKGKDGLPLRAFGGGIPSQSKEDDILKAVKHEHSGEVTQQGLEKPALNRLGSVDNKPYPSSGNQYPMSSKNEYHFSEDGNFEQANYSDYHQGVRNVPPTDCATLDHSERKETNWGDTPKINCGDRPYHSDIGSHRREGYLQSEGTGNRKWSDGTGIEGARQHEFAEGYTDGFQDGQNLPHEPRKNYSYQNNDPADYYSGGSKHQHIRQSDSDRVHLQDVDDHSQQCRSRGHNIVKHTESQNVSGNRGASGNQGDLGNQDGSHISYPSLDAETFSHQGDNNYRANPRFQGDFKVPSRDQVQESQHFVTTDPHGIYQRRDEHRAENQVPSAPAMIESDQYIHASVEGISSVGDSNSQSQLNPKHQPSSKQRISHISSSDDDDTDDESLHKGIDQDIKNIAEEVSEEVNRDPSFDQTMVHVPYDPNLVCPICGKKFRIGKIQRFRKHVDACV